MTTSKDWSELQRLFREALERPVAERADFLAANCADEGLRAQALELLDAYEPGEAFLEPPAVAAPLPLPERIAGFRIVREIGRGGMGIVYEAEQEHPRRSVALKVLRTNALSPSLARRFEYETHVLARLHHVGIAQIHEAGTALVGGEQLPYFAMELVRGLPLNHYLRDHRAGLRQRLELVARIADAVQHAHLSGVIHRDLKPSNILVTPDGQPKVLDFGVARATDADMQLTSVHTDVGQLIGTLPYMSPEQTRGEPEQLDTRSDVYALGVIAFEALTNRLPYDVERKLPLEAMRVIQEDEATRLSELDPQLRGDVETIVSKALEKERERRYATASGLAADIRRFLDDEPIVARPASRSYQLAKFARRNRSLVTFSVAFVVLLAVAAVVSTTLAFQRTRALDAAETARDLAETRGAELELAGASLRAALESANDAREEAEQQRTVAEAVRDFLAKDVLAQGDPRLNFDRGLTMEDALVAAAGSIDARFRDQPTVELALRRVLATSFQHLRVHERALVEARRIVALVSDSKGVDSLDARAARRDLAVIELDLGQPQAARDELEALFALDDAEYPPAHIERLRTMANLASALYVLETNGRAQELLEEAVQLAQGDAVVPPEELWRWKKKLAEVRQSRSDYPGAFQLLEELQSEQSAALGDDHPDVLDTRNSLALAYMETFQLARAEELSRDVVARAERVLGAAHLSTLSARAVLANVLQRQGRFEEALGLHTTTLEAQQARGESAASDALATQYSMAAILQAVGRLDEAEALAQDTLSAQLARFSEAHYFTVLSLNLIGMIHNEQGRLEEAAAEFERVIRVATAVHGRRSANVASGINNLASVYENLGRYADALPLYEEVIELHGALFGVDSAKKWISVSNLGGLYWRVGRLEEAEESLHGALAGLRTSMGARHWLVGVTLQKYAMCLATLGRSEEALNAARESVQLLEEGFGPGHVRSSNARETLEILEARFASAARD